MDRQLSKLLEIKGDKRGAKRVIYSLRRQQALARGCLSPLVSIPFAWLENPFRILSLLSVCLLVGTITFGLAAYSGAMAPTEKGAYIAWAKGDPLPNAYPRFQPFIYTLENALPLVKLGQDEKWAPDSARQPEYRTIDYRALTVSRWLLILLGWFQATLLAGAIGSRFKS